MKTTLIIFILFCSIQAIAQNGALKLDTAKTASSTVWRYSEGNNYLIKPSIPTYYFTAIANKIILKTFAPDSLGIVKVWINRKEITWTSDSTFTYKTDPK